MSNENNARFYVRIYIYIQSHRVCYLYTHRLAKHLLFIFHEGLLNGHTVEKGGKSTTDGR